MRSSALSLAVVTLSLAAANFAYSEEARSFEIIGPPVSPAPATEDTSPAGTYFAVVHENGKLERGSTGVSSSVFGFRGQYRVIFPRNLDRCGFVAAQARATAGGEMPLGFTSAQSLSYDRRSILVVTTDMAGSVKGRSFQVLATCP